MADTGQPVKRESLSCPKSRLLIITKFKEMLRVFFPLIATVSLLQSVAQKNLRPLAIGDKVPNVEIGYDFNHPSKKIRLYDIKASLIILDFWSIRCGSCLHSMSHIDSLKQQFKGKARLFTLTTNKKNDIEKTFAKLKITEPLDSIISVDSSLVKLFPHSSVPHHIWLDSNYRVRYITIGSNATVANFQAFLEGKQLPLVFKHELENFDDSQPLWLEGNGRLYSLLQSYSYIMKFVPGANNRMGRFYDSARNVAVLQFYNFSILSMIKLAFEKFPLQTFENNNRVVLDVRDSSMLFPPSDPNDLVEWALRNKYCYELSLPMSKADELYSVMQQDMMRYFNYDINIEKRKMPCLALVRTSNVDKIKAQGKPSNRRHLGRDSILLSYAPLSQFVHSLIRENESLKMPVIDETGYEGRINMVLGAYYNDIEKLRVELSRYDLDLVEKVCEVEMLVIRDKKKDTR
jgi:thiol-disulfide isomerase/thioredoxin